MTTAPAPVRRTVALAAAVLTAALTGAVVPIATGVAHAATPTPTEFVVADANGDGFAGLYRRVTPSGPLTVVAAESTTSSFDVESVSASRDGSRFVDVESTYDALGNPSRTRIVVRDVSGRTVQKVEDLSASPIGTYGAVLSPNGTSVVWNRFNFTTNATTMVRAVIGGGAPVVIGNDVSVGTFLNDSTLLVNSPGGVKTMPATGGAATALAGLPAYLYTPTVSPDGSLLAWGVDTTPSGATVGTADLQVAPLSFTGAWQVGSPTTVATGQYNHDLSFAGPSTLLYVRDDGRGGPGSILSAPTDGSNKAGTPVGPAIGDVYSQATGSTDDGTAPGAATLTPAILNGASVTLHWSLPADADLSGVLITRTQGPTTSAPVYVPAPVTSRVETSMSLSVTYTFTITAVDRSGNTAAATTRQVTPLAAKPIVYDPTSTKAVRAPFVVTFAPSSPAGATFNVDYRSSRNRTYQPWITGVGGVSRTFGSAGTTGVAATTSLVGTTYQFRVRGTDAYGNSTPLVASTLAVVPFDHTKGTYVGGTTVSQGSAWMGSYRQISTTAQKVTVSVTGNRFQLVGWRCTRCGVFDVYEGSTRVGTVDSYASSTKPRLVLFTRTWTTSATRTLTLKPRGTAGRPGVIIDGFAVRSVV